MCMIERGESEFYCSFELKDRLFLILIDNSFIYGGNRCGILFKLGFCVKYV